MKKTMMMAALALTCCLSATAQEKLFNSANVKSPVVNADGTVTFNLFAPKAVKVEVTGDFLPTTKTEVEGFGTVDAPGVAQLKEDKNGVWTISNFVYKMTYKLSENPKWNLWSAKPLNDRWLVEWKVITNSPKVGNCGYVAGQKRKFEDRATAESYLNGRIRAYAKLFTELSPPVPENYKVFFMESGHILPGYRIEGQEQHQNKTSVLNQLNEAKSQQKAAPATPSKKKTEPEL